MSFIEAMNRVRTSGRLQREVVAFIMVPAWVRAARADLKEAIEQDIKTTSPLQIPFITHWLHNMPEDKVLNYINHAGFTNAASEKLKIIFVPCYLDGKGGIFNKTYYDMLIGMDATVYPSYYEPWGYTPLEVSLSVYRRSRPIWLVSVCGRRKRYPEITLAKA